MIKLQVYLFIVVTLLCACQEQKRALEPIDFTTYYKFSTEIEGQVSRDTIPWKYQISAADYAKKGDYKNALIHWDFAMPTSKKSYSKTEIDSIHQKYSIVKASDYIVKEAKKRQVVIINEAHHSSMHRAFTRSLLQELFDNGYKNLGLEALNNGETLDSALNSRGYPVQKTAYYIQDPQFGNLVREALEIGYHVFAYEYVGAESGAPREIGQAENIKKIIDAQPNEKFIIHCGFAHSLEGPYKRWGKAMAGRITEYTGIDPLTINQAHYSERSKTEYNHPLLKALTIQEPSVLIEESGEPLRYERDEAWTDIAVLHPSTHYVDNRPQWLFEAGKQKVAISLNGIQMDFPVIVLAYKKGENINEAIPVDIIEIQNQNEKYSFGLKKGAYEMVVTNGKQSVKFDQNVN